MGVEHCGAVIVHRDDRLYRVLTAAHCVGEVYDDENKKGRIVKRLHLLPDVEYSVSPEVDGPWTAAARLIETGNLSEGLDYALLEFSSPKELPVSLVDVEPLRMGDSVTNVSAPEDRFKAFLFGRVARIKLNTPIWKGVLALQMTGIAPGSSGSPVFDENGHVRGIVVGQVPDNPSLVIMLPAEQIH
jgi:S1-C subfamily serine protease